LCTFAVALRKESVDRNNRRLATVHNAKMSLSARRAWIEIIAQTARNTSIAGSLSARRAWIEMGCSARNSLLYTSLSARRAWIEIPPSKRCAEIGKRRSPQGERG